MKSGMTKYPKVGDYSSELTQEQSINQFTTPSFVKQFIDKDENKQNLVRWYNRHPGAHSSSLLLNSTDDQLPSRLFHVGPTRLAEQALNAGLEDAGLQDRQSDSEGHKISNANNEILADRPEPKYNSYHSSSIPYLYDNPRLMPYSEHTFKPTFDSREKELAYRSRIYWRCYFNAISCF